MTFLITFFGLIILFFTYSHFKAKKEAEQYIQEGVAFLSENKTKEGVIETSTGLQYKVLKRGEGGLTPTKTQVVEVHYEGKLLSGEVFDSSFARGEPVTFPLNRVIAGWTEGLQLMSVGDDFELYIPSNLAYGNRQIGSIPPGSTLIFKVELLGVK